MGHASKKIGGVLTTPLSIAQRSEAGGKAPCTPSGGAPLKPRGHTLGVALTGILVGYRLGKK
jgi:hypothetical protein